MRVTEQFEGILRVQRVKRETRQRVQRVNEGKIKIGLNPLPPVQRVQRVSKVRGFEIEKMKEVEDNYLKWVKMMRKKYRVTEEEEAKMKKYQIYPIRYLY